jgi:hypothetical protein
LGLLVRFDEPAGSVAPASPAKASEVHFAGVLPKMHI